MGYQLMPREPEMRVRYAAPFSCTFEQNNLGQPFAAVRDSLGNAFLMVPGEPEKSGPVASWLVHILDNFPWMYDRMGELVRLLEGDPTNAIRVRAFRAKMATLKREPRS